MAIKVSKMAKKGRILPKMTKNVLKSPKIGHKTAEIGKNGQISPKMTKNV